MSRKIVGMITSYPNLDQRDWLWQQTPHPFGVWGNMQMVATHPQPDFLLMYQFDFPKPQQPTPFLSLGGHKVKTLIRHQLWSDFSYQE